MLWISIRISRPYHSLGLFFQTDEISVARLTKTHNYGNLCFSDDAFPGCEKAEIVGGISQSLKDLTESRYVIGPVVDRGFWHRERAAMDLDRGPCELECFQVTNHKFINIFLRETGSKLSEGCCPTRSCLDRQSCHSKAVGWLISNI
jgi:hypothetical protein